MAFQTVPGLVVAGAALDEEPVVGHGARHRAGAAPSTWTSGSQRSQEGRYQLRSPSSCIAAGTSTRRTMVASSSRAIATPNPICWNMTRSPRAKPLKTAMMIRAPPVMMRPVEPTPWAIASLLSPVRRKRSRMRLSRNTW